MPSDVIGRPADGVKREVDRGDEMVNEIADGISTRLREALGDEYQVYRGGGEQEFRKPCFLIEAVKPSVRRMIGDRYRWINPFEIRYFPQGTDQANGELDGMADRLFEELEYVTVEGDLLRGTGMRCEKADGKLSFFVEYNLFTRGRTEEETMGDFNEVQKIKE